MASIFLDANKFIDLVEARGKANLQEKLIGHSVSISTLSVHILTYVYKYKIPNEKLKGIGNQFALISFDAEIVKKSLLGPTEDFEDNIQLNSAVADGCDLFLTDDKKLLRIKKYKKVEIVKMI